MTKIGAAVTPKSGESWAQAITSFETLTSRTMQVRRCYDGAPFASIQDSQVAKDLGTGRKSILSMKPTMSTPMTVLESFATELAAEMVTSGHECDVIIYHEPVDNMSGSAFISLYQRSVGPFRDRGIPVGVCYTNWSATMLPYSNTQSALKYYWPGDELVDFIAIDEYPASSTGTPVYTPMNERMGRVAQFADTKGKPLSLTEFGILSSWDTIKSETWIRSITDWALQRAADGVPLRDICYFHSDVAGSGNSWWLNNKAEYVDAFRDMYDLLGV